MAETGKSVEVSRRIEASTSVIFEILTNPHRHVDFDGSGMLRGAVLDRPIANVGDTFVMKMHRLGDDYLMLNYVVEFAPGRRIFWEPAPGDPSRAEGNDPSKVGIPAGYRWGYILTPDGDDATLVTEVFDCGPLPDDLLRDGGAWINGTNPVLDSMTASLEMLEKITARAMAEHPSWNSAYQGVPPWDIGGPQPGFVKLADAGKLRGRVLDAGCGTGEQVLLAAKHGAEAMGVDISDLAIERARAKAAERGVAATFEVADVLHLEQLERQFDVVTDSGVFHVFDDEQRPRYVSSLRSVLHPGGMYYMMCFSDRQPGDWGPRRVSQQALRAAFAEGWSIRSIEAAKFDVTIEPDGVHAWLATIERL